MGRAVLHEGQWIADGDPMEAAIDALAARLADPGQQPEEPEVSHRFAFDPRRLRESAIVGTTLFVKGAPESVIPLCGEDSAGHALQMVDQMASHGLRVLAVAERSLPGLPGASFRLEEVESGLTLLGLIGLHDPPRAEVRVALEAAREAGIKVAMVTGDHAFTAAAIARETGLIGSPELVLEGHNLPEDDAVLAALLDRDGVVVSRVTPEQKLRVARLLQHRGHVVAMTGDGVNDGPALQQADIGVAMGLSGTDVAREAADLVLLDDDFATIIAAVEQGRATYANIRRFLTYHLTDNVAELTPFVIWALSGGRFPLALSVLQILALDIGTDLLPALALGSEAPSKGTLKRPPERSHLMDKALMFRVFGLLGPVEALLRNDGVHGRAARCRLDARGGTAAVGRADGGLRRRVHHRGPGPARQRVRLPQRLRAAVAARLVQQPAADLGGAGRTGAAGGVPVPRAAGRPAGPRPAVARWPGRGARRHTRRAARRLAVQDRPPPPGREGHTGHQGPKTLTPDGPPPQDGCMTDSPVLWFEEIGMGDVPQVGGKNASLGELIQSLKAKGVRVPDGFATTADAYRRFLEANGIEAAMRSRIQSYRSGETSLRATGEAIRELFLDSEFPDGHRRIHPLPLPGPGGARGPGPALGRGPQQRHRRGPARRQLRRAAGDVPEHHRGT